MNSLPDHGVGVDRLSISFRVRDWLDLGRWDRRSTDVSGGWTAQTKVGGGGSPEVMVGIRSMPQGGVWGKAEVNPSRFVDPEGCGLLPLRMLPAALEVMWAAAREVVAGYDGQGLNDASVKRVDVARDFRGVTDPGLYVEGLAPLHRNNAKRNGVWSDASRGGAQTLQVGNGQGMVRLYDQHAAYAEKGAPAGSLRWEGELRSGWLQSVGVKRVGDLDAVSVVNMAAKWWEWSKMGQQVTGPVHAVALVEQKVRAEEISVAVAQRLLGAMLMQSFGSGSQAGRTTSWKYRKLSDELGLSTASLWSNDLSRQAVGRLDFESGTEILALS